MEQINRTTKLELYQNKLTPKQPELVDNVTGIHLGLTPRQAVLQDFLETNSFNTHNILSNSKYCSP